MVNDEFSPDDAVSIIDSKLKLKVVRRTMLNYEQKNLMPRAKRSDNGREAYYTKVAVAEFYASWKLLHGDFITTLPGFNDDDKMRLSPKFVAYAREYALRQETVKNFDYFSEGCFEEIKELSEKPDFLNYKLISGFVHYWVWYKKTALLFLEK